MNANIKVTNQCKSCVPLASSARVKILFWHAAARSGPGEQKIKTVIQISTIIIISCEIRIFIPENTRRSVYSFRRIKFYLHLIRTKEYGKVVAVCLVVFAVGAVPHEFLLKEYLWNFMNSLYLCKCRISF